MTRRIIHVVAALLVAIVAQAQIGDRRTNLAVGVNGGYSLTNIRFTPKVNQSMLGGATGGLTFRYTCEKYFSSICAIQAEVNYSQLGWKEDIRDYDENPVIGTGGEAERYSRTINYVQVPLLARMGWGREQRGMQFFFQAGPQFGFCLSEKTSSNFTFDDMNYTDRVSKIVRQDTMAVENKFDYGITVGAGMEYSHPKAGHLLLEARYYYGLGNIYGDSKRDYFASSNFGNIVVKLTYLFDIIRTKP